MRLRSGQKRAIQKLLPNIRLRDMVKKRLRIECENSHHRNNVQTDPHCLTTVVFAHDATGNSVTTVLHMCSPKFALKVEVPSSGCGTSLAPCGGSRRNETMVGRVVVSLPTWTCCSL